MACMDRMAVPEVEFQSVRSGEGILLIEEYRCSRRWGFQRVEGSWYG